MFAWLGTSVVLKTTKDYGLIRFGSEDIQFPSDPYFGHVTRRKYIRISFKHVLIQAWTTQKQQNQMKRSKTVVFLGILLEFSTILSYLTFVDKIMYFKFSAKSSISPLADGLSAWFCLVIHVVSDSERIVHY